MYNNNYKYKYVDISKTFYLQGLPKYVSGGEVEV